MVDDVMNILELPSHDINITDLQLENISGSDRMYN